MAVGGRRDAYSRSSFEAKRFHQRRMAGWKPTVLYTCRMCRVSISAADRDGHLTRSHKPTDMVTVCFTVKKNGKVSDSQMTFNFEGKNRGRR